MKGEAINALLKECRSFLRETRAIVKANSVLRTTADMRIWLERESALSERIAALPNPTTADTEGRLT